MNALARGFLTGLGFALGAATAGTLFGYSIGKIAEHQAKQFMARHKDEKCEKSSGTNHKCLNKDMICGICGSPSEWSGDGRE